MTEAQTNNELTKIRANALTLNEYLRLSRAGENFSMTRKQRKEVYSLYLDEVNATDSKRTAMKMRTLSDKGAFAYNAITKHRDEVMLVTA